MPSGSAALQAGPADGETSKRNAGERLAEEAKASVTTDAANRLQEVVNTITSDPETGYKTLIGGDAIRGFDGRPLADVCLSAFDDSHKAIRDGLGSPAVRARFDEVAAGMRARLEHNVVAHEARQGQIFQSQVRAQTVAASVGAVLSNPDAVGGYGDHIAQARDALIQDAVVQGFMKANQPLLAKAFLDAHQDDMEPSDAARLAGTVDPAAKAAEIMSVADDAWKHGGLHWGTAPDFGVMDQWGQAHFKDDPESLNAFRREIAARIQGWQADQKFKSDAASEQIFKNLLGGQTLSSQQSGPDWAQVRGPDQTAISHTANERARVDAFRAHAQDIPDPVQKQRVLDRHSAYLQSAAGALTDNQLDSASVAQLQYQFANDPDALAYALWRKGHLHYVAPAGGKPTGLLQKDIDRTMNSVGLDPASPSTAMQQQLSQLRVHLVKTVIDREAQLGHPLGKQEAMQTMYDEIQRIDPLNRKADSGPGPENKTSFWDLGWQFATGKGPRHQVFRQADPATKMLMQDDNLKRMRIWIAKKGRTSVGVTWPWDNNLGGLQGTLVYVQQYSSAVTNGKAGNLAGTYLGSYSTDFKITGIDKDDNAIVRVHVWNDSDLKSATHPPLLGYSEWWERNVEPPIKRLQPKEGPLSPTRQDFYWTEKVKLNPASAKRPVEPARQPTEAERELNIVLDPFNTKFEF